MINSALPLVVVIGGILFLVLTHSLFSASPVVIALQLAAIALNVSARLSFPREAFRVSAAPGGSEIIRRGPYRFIRHPMYAAVLLFIWTAILSHLSWLNVSVGIVVTAFACARVIAEERLLRQRFPGYIDYARSTKAIIPFVI
jgi:protein-S-isoprenylcysteine O-methyltransferase Ste14